MQFKFSTSADKRNYAALILFYSQVHSMGVVYMGWCQVLCWILELQIKK